MVNIFDDRHSDAMSLKQCFGNSFRRVKVANSVWQLNNYNSIGAVSNNGTESERCFHLHVYTLNDKVPLCAMAMWFAVKSGSQ
jgi:hypothetical protein